MPARYRVGIIGHTDRGNYGHGIDTVWSQAVLSIMPLFSLACAEPHSRQRIEQKR